MAKQSNRDNKRVAKAQRNDQLMNRVSTLFVVGVIAEFYLLMINQRFVGGNAQTLVAIYDALNVISIVGAVMAVLGLVLMLVKKGCKTCRGISLWLMGVGAFLALSSQILNRFYPKGGGYLCVLIPIVTVLGVVYYLFQREFFAVTVILGGAMFTVWVCRKGLGTATWNTVALAGSVLVLIGLVGVAVLTNKVQKNEGKWIGKCGCRIFPVSCDYRMLYIAYALAFVAIVLALVMVTTTYYSLWALGIILFAYAVYYTTKLM